MQVCSFLKKERNRKEQETSSFLNKREHRTSVCWRLGGLSRDRVELLYGKDSQGLSCQGSYQFFLSQVTKGY